MLFRSVGAQALPAALEAVADGVQIIDIAVDHGVARERLDDIALNPVQTLARFRDFNQFDRRRTDVTADQGWCLGLEKALYDFEVELQFSLKLW